MADAAYSGYKQFPVAPPAEAFEALTQGAAFRVALYAQGDDSALTTKARVLVNLVLDRL